MVSCEGWLQTAFTVYEFKLCLCTPEVIEASQRCRVRGYTLNHWPQLTAPKNFIGDNHIHQRVWVLELRRRQTKQKSTFCVVVLPFYTPWSGLKPPLRYRLGRASVLETAGEHCSLRSNRPQRASLPTCRPSLELPITVYVAVFLGYKMGNPQVL